MCTNDASNKHHSYSFEEIFDIDEIQKIQNAFAIAAGVASVITDIYGNHITKPSNYCELCTDVIQGCAEGSKRCAHSHGIVENFSIKGPSFKYCLSAGMMDGGACIFIEDKHVANWLIGQVLEDTTTDESMMEYCREIGADEERFAQALAKVRRVSKDQYMNICNSVYLFAKQLSTLGLNNIILKKEMLEKEKREQEINYLSLHDPLTGLYNRRYFESCLSDIDASGIIPVSIIMGDVNGLKMANDAFGHMEGDLLLKRIGKIFDENSLPDHIPARIGGDEFVMILPGIAANKAAKVVESINRACSESHESAMQLSISIGFAEKNDNSHRLVDIFKDAEDNMYRNKLVESRSTRSSIIASLRKTLEEKTHETEAHCSRLKILMIEIAKNLGMNDINLTEFELLGILHDIGKVAIPDHILEKPGKLNNDEWRIMRNHSEIGYRIAASTPELIVVADAILCHHERWDGKGYPQGLSGDQIPLSSRVLSIVDSFDAIVNDRPYRKALPVYYAVEEIKKCAGTQFDPTIVKIFLEVIENKELIDIYLCQTDMNTKCV